MVWGFRAETKSAPSHRQMAFQLGPKFCSGTLLFFLQKRNIGSWFLNMGEEDGGDQPLVPYWILSICYGLSFPEPARSGRAPGGSQPSSWRRTGTRERPEIGQGEAAEAVQSFYAQKGSKPNSKFEISFNGVPFVSHCFPLVSVWFLFAAENHTRRQPSTSR